MIHKTIELPVQYRSRGIENNDFTPRLSTYFPENSEELDSKRKHPLVLICPGGGYAMKAFREAEPVALKLNALGFHTCVLDYSVAPMDFPAAFLDLCEAMHYVRSHAEESHIAAEDITVAGFSAGGHLAASLGVWWNSGLAQQYLPYAAQELKPNRLLLCYPVISSGKYRHDGSIANVLGPRHDTAENREFVSLEKQVTKDVPPAFIWHTFEDEVVPIQNTLLFASALAEHGVSFEYHVFTKGCHGLSLASPITATADGGMVQEECTPWPELFARWCKTAAAT